MELWRQYAECLRVWCMTEDEFDQYGAWLELQTLEEKIEDRIGTDGSEDGVACLILQDEFIEQAEALPATALLEWLESRVTQPR